MTPPYSINWEKPMKQNEKWLQWAVELQALAQAGLTYGKDVYDRERYTRIREIAAEMVAHQAELPLEKVTDLFCSETGYQTPKLDTRAAIFREDRILLVKENTIKEVKEEAGLDVTADLVIAVQDREKHNRPIHAHKICKIFVLCTAVGGEFAENSETTESGYFALDALPPLAEAKNTAEQIKMCFDAYHAEHWVTQFD